MIKEEEKTIYRLNKDKNNPLACGDITIVNVEDIETVLNMLKEKDREIEKKDKRLKRQFNLLTRKDRDIHHKDKIIDLMAGAFKQDDVRSVEEIKKYFERKSKND
mgnify:CR=1 FL=1